MGRESTCPARVGDAAGDVTALLESTEIILRGAIKRRWPLAQLQGVAVRGQTLAFSVGAEAVTLALGEAEARKWADKLSRPPPTLAAKLGVSAQKPAWVLGQVADAALAEALAGATTPDLTQATQCVAVIDREADLAALLERLPAMPVWAVYPKGGGFDAVVRNALRGAGFADNKTSAVSERYTATRYAPKK